MKKTTFETVKSCYFGGVCYWINYEEVPGTKGNESFFTVEQVIEQDSGQSEPLTCDLGKEFDTQAAAAAYARKFDSDKALERDEIRYGVQ